MKNRFKNWWNRPITRGDYVKWSMYSVAASVLYGIGVYGYLKHEEKKIHESDVKENTEEVNDNSENY